MSLSIIQGTYYSTSGNAVIGVEFELSLSVSALVWFCVVSLVMVELKANVLETEKTTKICFTVQTCNCQRGFNCDTADC